MSSTTRESIDRFLQQRRIAIVGVSRTPKDFSRAIFDEFRRRGYDVVPVNPNANEIDGVTCYKSVKDISPAVDAALLITTPKVTEQVVRDCAATGVKHVWMQRGEGIGSVSPEAVAFCEQNGINVVPGQCPFMFLPATPFFHRIHGFVKKLSGSYPV
jgi:uncharacterized protein